MRMERGHNTYPVKLTADPATSQVLSVGAVAGAVLMVVDGGGTIEWYAKDSAEGELFKLFDSEGKPCATAVSAGNAFELPASIYACGFLVGGGADVEGFISVSG